MWYHHYLRFDREHQCDGTAKQMHSKLFTWFLFFKLAMIFWEMAAIRRNSSHGKSVSLWLYRKSICRLHWKLGFTVPIPHAFQYSFFHGWLIIPGKLMHFKNSFLHGLSPPKSFIKKFLLDKKLWLFQNRVQVAPSTSCLPGSKGFSWEYSCFQGLYGQNTKLIRSKKAKQSAKTKGQA